MLWPVKLNVFNHIAKLSLGRSIYSTFKLVTLFILFGHATPSYSQSTWSSFTLDNDTFVGNDNGYSNGLYFSRLVSGEADNELPEHDFWVKPLMWSLPDDDVKAAVNAYMVGQTMSTPSDITIEDPDQNDLPYSALLALTNTYLVVTPNYADSVATTVGIVGPAALGEETQKFVHDLIDSDEPEGWDTQLDNELVFQFSRARTWRALVSASGNIDVLTNANFSLGTIQSAIGTGATLRYGRNLLSSYATTLFNSSRTLNPVAVENGWYVYTGVTAGYIFNQIFTDGNTFEDSRSIEYDNEYMQFSFGIAYAWQNSSFTFAITDANILQSGDTEDELKELTRFGTITYAWRLR